MRKSIVALALLWTTSAFASGAVPAATIVGPASPSVDDQTLDTPKTYSIYAHVVTGRDKVTFHYAHKPWTDVKECMAFLSGQNPEFARDNQALTAAVQKVDPKGTLEFKCEADDQ